MHPMLRLQEKTRFVDFFDQVVQILSTLVSISVSVFLLLVVMLHLQMFSSEIHTFVSAK